jgi:hypothetical protein
MTARRHHYLPEAYLKGFADDASRPQLQVFDLKTRSRFTASPDNVAVERDFNRVDIPGRPIDQLEDMLSRIEGDVISAIRRIQIAGTLNSVPDLHLVLNLVGLILARNPRFRRSVSDSFGKVVKGIANLSTQTPERYAQTMGRPREGGPNPVSYEDMKAFVKDDSFKEGLAQNWQIGLELSVVSDVIEMLARRKWSLLRSPASTGGFVTCDHPACLNWINPRSGPFGPGLGLPGTSVVFPLSRELCLMGEFETDAHVLEIDFLSVAHVNGAIIANAERQVYAADDRFIFFRLGETLPNFGYELLSAPTAGAGREESR